MHLKFVNRCSATLYGDQDKLRSLQISILSCSPHLISMFLVFSADVMREIAKAGFKEPSPIQKQAWPIALQGLDLIGIAQVRC